jgi:hypothetical protein
MRIRLVLALLVAFPFAALAEDHAPPTRPRRPFQNATKHDLDGFWGIGRGDLAGKRLKDVIREEATARVIVLANNTQAPNNIHLRWTALLIELNPIIESAWKNTPAGQMSQLDGRLTAFFAVLLEDKNGRVAGLVFMNGDKGGTEETVKVVSEDGIGLIRTAPDWKKRAAGLEMTKGGAADQPQGRLAAALRPPIKLDELLVWRDGGTLGFKLSDAGGRHVAFCVDRKIKSPIAGHFFLNVTHADQKGGERIDLGSDTEQTLISYLQSWLSTKFTQEQLSDIIKIRDFRKRTKDEFNASHVLQLIENRAKEIQRVKELQSPNKGTARPAAQH